MELFRTNKNKIITVFLLLTVILIGNFFYKNYKAEKENPTLIKAEGIKVSLNEVSETIGEKPNGPHNSLEYKKLMAPGILKNKLIDQWAKEEGLTTLQYIEKIKKNADIKITEEEFNKHLEHNNINRAKLTPAQIKSYTNILIENKKQDYFHAMMDKKINEILKN